MNIVIETIDLVKEYGDTKAVSNASVKIEDGNIYGFIGKNGAGKTTFIRMISGLVYPTSGEIIINGKKDSVSLAKQRKNMSFIIETPYHDPGLTAYQNMELQRLSMGLSFQKKLSQKWLDFVGLGNTGEKKLCEFSLGMRQRLGIAMAMMSEPNTLFLDEPINGLDPTGIIQMRDLIKSTNHDFNTTIIISSHILSELYQVATNYIFIDKGSIIGQFSKKQLDENCKSYVSILTNNAKKSADILKKELGYIDMKADNGNELLKVYDSLIDTSKISYHLVSKGISLYEIKTVSVSLEDFFISKIEK